MATTIQNRRLPSLERILITPWLWLKRARGWRRRGLLLLYLVVVLVTGVLGWRAVVLVRLPDVGDPFDIKAFVAEDAHTGDATTAALYRQAAGKVKVTGEVQDFQRLWGVVRSGWPKASPGVRDWLEQSRAALELWRRATDRPPPIFERPATIRLFEGPKVPDLHPLTMLALLEGSRLEAAGDMAGAWGWYRAVLRAGRHLQVRGRFGARLNVESFLSLARERIRAWAGDPRTDAALLRTALDEFVAFDQQTPPVSDMYKIEYLAIMHELENPDRMMRGAERAQRADVTYEETRGFQQVYWFFLREPERSRRVTRLFYANWLAHCDKPAARRPKTVGNAELYSIWLLYEPDAEAPAAARAVPPKELFNWLTASPLVWRFLMGSNRIVPELDRSQKSRAVLIVALAEQLYERQHGREPASTADLLGILKRLPEGYKPLGPDRPDVAP